MNKNDVSQKRIDTRDIALTVLLDMELNDTFSNIALSKALRQNQFSTKQDRAFLTRLVEGTVEQRLRLDYIINQFLKIKINKCKPFIRCLLRMSLYQILYMDSVPDSAACNEAVKLAKKHGFGSLSGFVNGVLRSISRDRDNIKYPEKEAGGLYWSIKYSVPEWLCSYIMEAYPSCYEKIFEGIYKERPTTIRVNTNKITKEKLKKLLEEKDITVKDGCYTDISLLIEGYDFIRRLPGYREGFFTVQDESSMCAVLAAGIKKGDTVIDVCAAPGGKSTLALECMNGEGMLYSMDISEEKLSLISENIERLGYTADIRAWDATEYIEELGGKADVVIADLPCSGLGIIGRKNDIKYRVTREQLDELANLQRRILDNVKRYVKPRGRLLFSTCTINPAENQENTCHFLEENEDYSLIEERVFLQGVDSCDGFYYAIFEKE